MYQVQHANFSLSSDVIRRRPLAVLPRFVTKIEYLKKKIILIVPTQILKKKIFAGKFVYYVFLNNVEKGKTFKSG